METSGFLQVDTHAVRSRPSVRQFSVMNARANTTPTLIVRHLVSRTP